MAQTSIHICPVKGGSELHNERRKELDYVRKELTSQNQTWKSPDFPGINEQHAKIAADYLDAHGKKMHANATPIREAVVVIQQDTTMQQLLTACTKCREKFGIEAMQIYTHKDEGHTAEDGTWKPNLHAHIVFNWYNTSTHTTHKLSRQDMAEMQTLFAKCLNMERGVSSDRKHLNAIQQKNQAEAAKLQHLQEQVQQQIERHKTELQQECTDLRKSGKETVRAFDYLCKFDAAKPTEKQQAYRDNLDQECRREMPTESDALSAHATALRTYLMNTINSVANIGKKLQNLASRIPLLKRHRLSHEAELENAVKVAENKAAAAVKEAETAKELAASKQAAASSAKAAAERKEKEAKETIKNLQARIDEAHKAGRKEVIDEWNKAYAEKYKPTADERDRLKTEVAQLKKDLDQSVEDHSRQAIETAKELQRNWGAATFENTSLDYDFTEFGSWLTAKQELRQEQAQQQRQTNTVSRGRKGP